VSAGDLKRLKKETERQGKFILGDDTPIALLVARARKAR
jgi:hypothetical protein